VRFGARRRNPAETVAACRRVPACQASRGEGGHSRAGYPGRRFFPAPETAAPHGAACAGDGPTTRHGRNGDPVIGPAAKEVASRHLTSLRRRPERTGWLDEREFTKLLGKNSSPTNAANLAFLISRVADDDESRSNAAQEFQQWPALLKGIFAHKKGDPEERALLIAAAFLDGAPALHVQRASQQLLGDAPEKGDSVRDILAGPDLTARLRELGVTVEDRNISFSEKPGLGKAALHHIWVERADLHGPLLKWIGDMTAPGKLAEPYLDSIAEILTDLALRHNDLRPIELAQTWARPGATDERLSLASRMLDKAATSDTLGSAVRSELRAWAAGDSENLAMITALVCQSDFSHAYPSQALVRLRWILQRPARDNAVIIAENAIRRMAADMDLLSRVWDTVSSWISHERPKQATGLSLPSSTLSRISPPPTRLSPRPRKTVRSPPRSLEAWHRRSVTGNSRQKPAILFALGPMKSIAARFRKPLLFFSIASSMITSHQARCPHCCTGSPAKATMRAWSPSGKCCGNGGPHAVS